MTKRVVTLLAVTLLTILLAASVCSVAAQAVAVSRVVIPCEEEATPGKPTLRRREATTKEAAAETANDTGIFTEKCKRETPESVALNQPVTLNFEGLISTDESALRKYLRDKRADLTGELTGNSSYFESTSQLIKEFLSQHGFRHAVIVGRADRASANPRAATFVINEGARTSIAEYRFQGNQVFSTAELAQSMRECMTGYHRDYYDPQVFDYCKYQLANFVKTRGYLKAEFGEPGLEESAGALAITIPVNEGAIYRIGNVKIQGSSLFAPEKLRAMGPLRKGEIADAVKLSEWLYEELKKLYGEQGYIQYTAEVEPEFKLAMGASQGTVDLEITIDEGHLFKVRKIKFAGAQLPDTLESMMLIHDCDVYNQSLFEKSIDNLNNSGLFEFIDKDKDADFSTNEEEALVDITINLKRRGR